MPEPKIPRETVKGNVYIRNMLSNIERTFLPIGSIIGKYRIVEEIDRGGMAVVYKAIQLDLDREVALKIMPSNISINRRFMERFMSEARAIARLNHPSIVSIIEVAMDNNIYYLAMEYIKGQNLFYYLNFNKPKLVDVLEIVSRLADALAYAHMQKIIHRDLKLNNVIMRDRLMPVLIDFGLAKAMEEEGEDGITRTGEIMGSPAYMAPERLLGGPVDHRSDICSLGIMLYEMLTFKNPYLDQRNLHQTALNVMEANPIPPRKLVPWLPAEIESVTLKAMARDSAARYQSMEEFKDDINRYQRNEPVMARPPSVLSRMHRFLKRRWSVISIAATMILFSALFAASLYIQSSKEKSHWQLLHNERFSGRLDPEEWSISPQRDTASWSMSNGTLTGRSDQRSFLRFARRFNHDVLIEFDIGASDKDLHGAGFFLFGETPDSAYCFYIGRDGSGACGLAFPGSRFLFRTADQAKIALGPVNHVVIERMQNAITLQINGIVAAKVWDYLPPLGRTHEQLGFFVEGCGVWVDNLKIFRRAVPQKPSPTFVADRFWERGDFEAALEEYRSLLVDFGTSERMKDIQLRIADCLVRLGRHEQAMMTLREAADLHGKDESFESKKLFLEGVILSGLGSEGTADSVFTVLAQRYPASAANQSAMASVVVRVASRIEASRLDSAEREISRFSGHYARFGDLWGGLSMMVIERYLGQRLFDSAAAVAQRILARQERSSETYVNAKAALGRVYLDKGRKERAADLFNQCIAAHLSSESIWEAWMGLASIYEHDFQYREATTIYQKIHRECPVIFRARWMAAIKLGELASRDSARHFASYFEAVVEGGHPFPLPRLIARFFLGEVNESRFKAAWDLYSPGDFMYLYYCARKAKFGNEEVVARIYLQDCIANLPHESWNYIVANRALNNFRKW
ncbi:MAG: protein kinase [Chitinispirillaceae bacterium]|nr:protein kinase [Chitinispirillaceae bacterium]